MPVTDEIRSVLTSYLTGSPQAARRRAQREADATTEITATVVPRLAKALGYPGHSLQIEPLIRFRSHRFRPSFLLRQTHNMPSIVGEVSPLAPPQSLSDQLKTYMEASAVGVGLGFGFGFITLAIDDTTQIFRSHEIEDATCALVDVAKRHPPACQEPSRSASPRSSPTQYTDSFSQMLDAISLARTNDEKKIALELFAARTFDSDPRIRTKYRNLRTRSSEIDLLCITEAPARDFWSDIGRHFLVECKNWKKPVGAKEVRDFLGKLQKTRISFGVFFSRLGITGVAHGTDAYLEIHSAYDRDGIIVALVTLSDIENCSDFGEVLRIIETRADMIRFDIKSEAGLQQGDG